MCGRYTLATDPDSLMDALPGITVPDNLTPRYNIAPSQPVAVVANNNPSKVDFFLWGLIPSWAKDPTVGNRMINARAESLVEKPSFRAAYRRRRCLVLADGFYEWRQESGRQTKTPIYIRLISGKPFVFAGLWDVWHSADGSTIYSCTIITTTPNELIEPIHNRMPVILTTEAYEQWLHPSEQRPDRLNGLLKPYPAVEMTAYPVSPVVNNPKIDSPACIAPAG